MALLATIVAALALTSTMLLLHIPTVDQETEALEKWNDDQGFLTDATLHLIPVIPRSQSALAQSDTVYRGLPERIMKAGEWFNQGADGRRTIFSASERAEPVVLTPKPMENEPNVGERLDAYRAKHECSDLIGLASTTAKALGPKKVVVLLVEKTWRCPFVGLAGFRSNWLIVTGWDPERGRFNYFTLIHELGHVLGLPHARKYKCTASIGIYEKPWALSKCDIDEYGDTSDPMGSTIDRMHPGFNAFNRYVLGWNDPPKVIDSPGKYRVNVPVLSSGSTPYVEIPGGFLISYRAPTGEEGDLDKKLDIDLYLGDFSGVYIHRKASDKNDGATYPILLPFRKMQTAGRIGDHFISQESNVAFSILDIKKGKRAVIEVHVGTEDQPVKDIWGPVPVLLTMQDILGNYLNAQWDAYDPSGIKEAFVVVNGKRQDSSLSGAIALPYTTKPQKMYFVAIDNEGNRRATETYIVPAVK